MKFWSKQRVLVATILVLLGFGIPGWQTLSAKTETMPETKPSKATSKMTYGRFLEYLDMGWIKAVDFYDNGRTAIIEASSPELGNRAQKIRVEIPVGTSPLILKLKEAKVNFTAHSSVKKEGLTTVLSNLFIPFVIVLGLFFVFQWFTGFLDGSNDPMNFRNSRAKVQMEATTNVLFEDVAGIDEAKEEFEEVVTFLKNPQPFTSVGAKIPKGVILVGPPGTGKTLLAKAIAGEAGVPFASISGSEFVEMFVGIGASRVRDIFKAAKTNAPCILFIDEIDAVGRQRGTGVGSGNDEREQTLNQILTEMDGFQDNTGVIVIAATNRVDVLDGALLRPGRFDRQVNVNLPDMKGRLEILKVHVRNKTLSEGVSLEMIAQRTPGFSGADLANLLNEAAILTARQNKSSMSMVEINTAIDRVIAGLEGTALTDTKNKRLVAYHEVGHAIIGSLLKSHDEVEKVSLLPRGQAAGLSWFRPNEDQALVSRGQLVARIMGSLGGRAAEEVVFGPSEITTGASNDFQQVTSLARQMVTRFGMSSLGPVSLDSAVNQPFLGRGVDNTKEVSLLVANKIDDQVKFIVKYSYLQSLKLLKQNRVLMDLLVDKLIQKESIEGYTFRRYLDEFTKLPSQDFHREETSSGDTI